MLAKAKKLNTGSVGQRLRAVIVTGELAGPEEAVEQLHRLDERLAEQGIKGEALDRAAAEAVRRSREQMEAEPAFARFAEDPGFRRAAGFAVR